MDVALYSILAIGIFLKFFLWLYCLYVNKSAKSDTIHALAEDHLNDVMSNSFAVAAAAIAYNVHSAWWVDPFGAILISVVIIYRWYDIISEQIKKIVGHTAPPEFIEMVQQLALDHDARIAVDCLRAYHFGARCTLPLPLRCGVFRGADRCVCCVVYRQRRVGDRPARQHDRRRVSRPRAGLAT